jgi:hypothetical protein
MGDVMKWRETRLSESTAIMSETTTSLEVVMRLSPLIMPPRPSEDQLCQPKIVPEKCFRLLEHVQHLTAAVCKCFENPTQTTESTTYVVSCL